MATDLNAKETPGERRTRLYLSLVDRWTKEGRGVGELATYKPWLTVHDVKSHGLRVRCWSHKTGRVHHMLSKLEYYFFLLAEHDPDVIDIREQLPIPIETSASLEADSKDFRHPRLVGGKNTLLVMTTDFVLTKRIEGATRYVVRNVKYGKEHLQPTVIAKLALERHIWTHRPPVGEGDVDFGVFTEKEVPSDYIRNLKWFRGAHRQWFLDGIKPHITAVEGQLRSLVNRGTEPLADLTDYTDGLYALEPGLSLAVVKWLIAKRHWLVNLDKKIITTVPLNFERSTYEPI